MICHTIVFDDVVASLFSNLLIRRHLQFVIGRDRGRSFGSYSRKSYAVAGARQ